MSRQSSRRPGGLGSNPLTNPVPPSNSSLDRNSFVVRLWNKALADGAWDPGKIDFCRDAATWPTIVPSVREPVRQICALFLAGERAVTLNLLPLMHIVASEGRLSEQLYLTSFLADEAKHVEVFSRFFECTRTDNTLPRSHGDGYLHILENELQPALSRLYIDPSPEAQTSAAATYSIVVEGVMADTGQYLLRRVLADQRILPGLAHSLQLLQRDESRHLAYGVYLISRLIAEHGRSAYKAFLDRMSTLKPLLEEATKEFVGWATAPERGGINAEELMQFSRSRFAARVQRILNARTQTLQEVERSESDVC